MSQLPTFAFLIAMSSVAFSFPQGIGLDCSGGKLGDVCGDVMEGLFGKCGWAAVPKVKVTKDKRRVLLKPLHCTEFGSLNAPKLRPTITKMGGSSGDLACFTCILNKISNRSAHVTLGEDSYQNISQPNAMIRADIDGTLRKYLSQIKHCYGRSLQYHSSVIGKIVVNFVLNGSGKPSRATVTSNTINPRVARNLLNACL